jgi:hypothetical protein
MLNLISLVFCLTFLPALAASFDRLIPLPMLTREDMLQKLNTEELAVSSTALGVTGEFKGRPVWERSKDGLLMPMVKIRVSVSGDENQQFHFKYKQKIYLPQTAKSQRFADLDYSIFDPDHLEVFQNGVKTGEVMVTLAELIRSKLRVLRENF